MKYLFIILVLAMFLIGCSAEDLKKKRDELIAKKNQNKTISVEENPCPEPEGEPLDRISYGTSDISGKLIQFIHSTPQDGFLYCQLTVLEEDLISNALIDVDERADVQVVLDRMNT